MVPAAVVKEYYNFLSLPCTVIQLLSAHVTQPSSEPPPEGDPVLTPTPHMPLPESSPSPDPRGCWRQRRAGRLGNLTSHIWKIQASCLVAAKTHHYWHGRVSSPIAECDQDIREQTSNLEAVVCGQVELGQFPRSAPVSKVDGFCSFYVLSNVLSPEKAQAELAVGGEGFEEHCIPCVACSRHLEAPNTLFNS